MKAWDWLQAALFVVSVVVWNVDREQAWYLLAMVALMEITEINTSLKPKDPTP